MMTATVPAFKLQYSSAKLLSSSRSSFVNLPVAAPSPPSTSCSCSAPTSSSSSRGGVICSLRTSSDEAVPESRSSTSRRVVVGCSAAMTTTMMMMMGAMMMDEKRAAEAAMQKVEGTRRDTQDAVTNGVREPSRLSAAKGNTVQEGGRLNTQASGGTILGAPKFEEPGGAYRAAQSQTRKTTETGGKKSTPAGILQKRQLEASTPS